MLSTITAAQTQFRHEDAQRRRDIAILASIRDRRAAETRIAHAAPIRATAPRTPARGAWARPIGIASACATAAPCVV